MRHRSKVLLLEELFPTDIFVIEFDSAPIPLVISYTSSSTYNFDISMSKLYAALNNTEKYFCCTYSVENIPCHVILQKRPCLSFNTPSLFAAFDMPLASLAGKTVWYVWNPERGLLKIELSRNEFPLQTRSLRLCSNFIRIKLISLSFDVGFSV